MTELVYVLVLEAKFCEFESRLGHQIRVQALYKSCLCVEPNNATTCKSIGSKISGDWRNWERSSFASFSQEFESPILHQIYPCVAQPGRALRLGRSGRMFESCHTDQVYSLVAQW